MDVPELIAKIRSLRIFVGEDWSHGPYGASDISRVEKSLGRLLDSTHKSMLSEIGGNFGFELGPVEVGCLGLNVSLFLGLDETDPYNIANWEGYRDQVPRDWYPFAIDSDGHLFCLTLQGAVYHIELAEESPQRETRPDSAGQRIADSFADLVLSLQLPEWAAAYLEEQES